ncbi:MAG: hypothetical protein EOO61_06360 [Hymenobacter sp.]|nr:MAG: hypothetical protein EOO61_06360 [Hymenobacter sp.]
MSQQLALLVQQRLLLLGQDLLLLQLLLELGLLGQQVLGDQVVLGRLRHGVGRERAGGGRQIQFAKGGGGPGRPRQLLEAVQRALALLAAVALAAAVRAVFLGAAAHGHKVFVAIQAYLLVSQQLNL